MTPIREPVDGNEMARELDERSRFGSFRSLELHLFHAQEKPTVAQEIGRIRESEYRAVGAGRNVGCDLDDRDLDRPGYLQLIAWDPEESEIVAMYRLIDCREAIRTSGITLLRTSTLFEFSNRFVEEVLSRSVELGRSVVNSAARRAIHGLFAMWQGLGGVLSTWRHVEYFFGNVSIYRSLGAERTARMVAFLDHWHGDPMRPVRAGNVAELPPAPEDPHERPNIQLPRDHVTQRDRDLSSVDSSALGTPLVAFAPEEYRAAFETFRERASKEGWSLPAILLSYLKSAPTMRSFDLASDPDFGNAWELAILVGREDFSRKTRKRIMTL